MKSERYDEYQLNNRYRIAFETLIIAMVLIAVNGFIKTTYIWAPPMLESLVLIYIPGLYFALRSIWRNAYISKKEKYPGFYITLFGIIVLVNLSTIGLSIYNGYFVFVVNGKLSTNAGVLLATIAIGLILITLIARKITDRRMMVGDE